MKTLEKVKELRQNVSEIRDLFNIKIPKWEQDKKHFDKTGFGFNIDERFSACSSIKIWFSSWMGTYGDSGCGTQTRLNKDVFEKHLVKYLNKNKKEIMLEIANSIELEAKELKSKAEEELNEQLKALSELDSVS